MFPTKEVNSRNVESSTGRDNLRKRKTQDHGKKGVEKTGPNYCRDDDPKEIRDKGMWTYKQTSIWNFKI